MVLHFGVKFSIFLDDSRDTVTQTGNTIFDQDGHLIKNKETVSDELVFSLEIFPYKMKITRLIFPVVKAGVTDERTSFHSCPFSRTNHLRMTFDFISGD
jgi:hypothetical protein